MPAQIITPVILSGGSGTRLWPVSRSEHPKQFIALTAPETMFELTLGRVAGLERSAPPIVVANAAHAEIIRKQAGPELTLILEPSARNTAPAIALAALALEESDSAMLVMPSDHVITDVPAFHAAIERARPLVADGWLVTFGIEPTAPETGFGYIALGDELAAGVNTVSRFVEKPDATRAAQMLAQGGHVWNAGIFLFGARDFLAALATHQPAMLAAARAAMAAATRQGAAILPDAAAFAQCPSDSIDYAVMERADKVACVPVSMGWSDVGSWDALYDLADKDEADNALQGAAYAIDAKGCLIRSDGPAVTVVGAEDLIVIASGDEIVILPRGRSQEVRKAVAALSERSGRS
ncbi:MULTISPECIES: mannose-1-phosphate guanylyltransferase/mannose-6-phosphate isomerase [Sphingobium]|uniref:mannose-1-phosphate guanylyltransferase/mannose-6-phosphate isomerase n=1 Tax=Sphingobium TaxID=165695 RepID=UPI0015EC4E12|nr:MULTISPECIES: mannose-1-phosphate guanylyltransferase/mannose-6-phosphate isomerase [Sphingobium]MCW2363317.1 mannose-1-phosphate guanylyltransferase/mannose-1-phosphate guanylyltransferase/mannose-6-phosphate isomerase [Sphingobium sp. B10D3B]MCW2403284.1 mannose-1-phosphate guanylyltransferase/mannose-1-phosphate guanylyltransferase/mannose-6-phosphate isomerase [Sphingobium sp. B10D7B]MCW2406981.1 mannose-1-phosphate guanylyltransferase/mannose-1-phosphate guanylyltransferase/mannose-6-pho